MYEEADKEYTKAMTMFKEYIDNVESMKEEKTPGLLKSYQDECTRLKEENDELKKTISTIQNTLNEDDYDRLAEEGVEIDGRI